MAPLCANHIMPVLCWPAEALQVQMSMYCWELFWVKWFTALHFNLQPSHHSSSSLFSQRSAYFFCDCHSSLHDTFTRYTFLLYNHFRALVCFKGWVVGAAFSTINHAQIILIDLNKFGCFLWTPVPLNLQQRQVCQQTEFPQIINKIRRILFVTTLNTFNFACNVMKLIRILPQHYVNPCSYYVYEISTFVSENNSCMYLMVRKQATCAVFGTFTQYVWCA